MLHVIWEINQIMEIYESRSGLRLRQFKKLFDLFFVVFALLLITLDFFSLTSIPSLVFSVGVFLFGLYGLYHTGRIASMEANMVTVEINGKPLPIPVDQIRWIAKNVMITFTNSFWLIIYRKQENRFLPQIYFAPNEKDYQLLSIFAKMGISLKNVS
jgi:hypothetical protein